MEMMVNSHNPDFGTLSSFIFLTWILAFYLEPLNCTKYNLKMQGSFTRWIHMDHTVLWGDISLYTYELIYDLLENQCFKYNRHRL